MEALEGKRSAESLNNGTDLMGDASKTAIAKLDGEQQFEKLCLDESCNNST